MFLSTSSNLVAVTAVLALVSSLVSSDLGAGSFPNFATTQYPDADRAHWGGVERSEAAVGFNVFRAYGSEERLGEQLPRRWGRDAASAHG